MSTPNERECVYYNLQCLFQVLHAEATRIEKGGSCCEGLVLRRIANFIGREFQIQDVPENWKPWESPQAKLLHPLLMYIS